MEGNISTLIFTLMLCVAVTHAGVSYIHWGRTKCPSGAVLLYKGFMVGNYYSAAGSGSNYLCSDQEPQFVRGQAGFQSQAGKLWGVQFYKSDSFGGQFRTDNVPSGNLNNQNMVCARCHIPDASDVFMLPGRQDCHGSGYDLVYKGYIAAAAADWADQKPHEYICLDETPEVIPGGGTYAPQSVLYPVQVACGILPCSSYTDGMEETCAVCSY